MSKGEGSGAAAWATAALVVTGFWLMPRDDEAWLAGTLFLGILAGVAAGWVYRRGSRRSLRALVGFDLGAMAGLLLSGVLIYHPFWSEDETRSQDLVLGLLVLGLGALGSLAMALVSRVPRG